MHALQCKAQDIFQDLSSDPFDESLFTLVHFLLKGLAGAMLRMKESLQAEMIRFARLKENDPDRCAFVYALGEEMITLAKNGRYSKFQQKLLALDENEVFLFFTRRMFLASLMGFHFSLSDLMLSHGFKVETQGLPSPLHEVLNTADDALAVATIEFLVERCKLDVDTCSPGTWETGLHVAVRRQLPDAVKRLVALGADVNAVALNDAMPLTMANEALKLAAESKDGDGKANQPQIDIAIDMVEFLVEHKARDTWRRDTADSGDTSVFQSAEANKLSTAHMGMRYSDSGTRAGDAAGSTLAEDRKVMRSFSGGGGGESTRVSFAGGGPRIAIDVVAGGGVTTSGMMSFSGGGPMAPPCAVNDLDEQLEQQHGVEIEAVTKGIGALGRSSDGAHLFSTGD